MSPTLTRLFEEYAADHRHPMNRLTHKVAIPFITFHVMAMLGWVQLGAPFAVGAWRVTPTLGVVGWLLATLVYLRWSVPLGLGMSALLALCLPLGAVTPGWLVVVIAVVAWVIQLAGHAVWEKNRPSFTKNIQQMLVGPIFFLAVLTGAWRPGRSAPASA